MEAHLGMTMHIHMLMMITCDQGVRGRNRMQVHGEMGEIGKCIVGSENLLFGDGDSEIWF